MGLLSHFKRKSEASADLHRAAPVEPDAVAAVRTRARRRLIGATVLLGIGVIGFPLLFETQPRPVSVNIPIEIPHKDGAVPLALPPVAPLSAASAAVLDIAPARAQVQADHAAAESPAAAVPLAPEIVERAADQGRDVPAVAAQPLPRAVVSVGRPAPASTPPSASARLSASPAPAAAVVKPVPATPKPPTAAKSADDGARARALLDGQGAATASASAPAARMVVQVGAYADAAKLAEARQKLEKLGLKTYTQVIEVDGAKRTRVRVGPFASRADADKAAARIKSAGLPVAILTL